MRIACPSCHAEYEVPDAMLADGPRQLRCARCGHGFRGALPAVAPAAPPVPEPPSAGPPLAGLTAAGPEQGVPATAPPSEPAATDGVPAPVAPEPLPLPATGPDRPPPTRGPLRHSPIDASAQAPSPPPSSARLAAAWLGSVALVGAGGAALLLFHAEIAAAWPPAARLYAALGLG